MTIEELYKILTSPEIEYGKCRCGCGMNTKIPLVNDSSRGRNYVKGIPTPWIAGHSRRKFPAITVSENGCWIWQRRIYPNGYGQGPAVAKKITYAHRYTWVSVYGPVPAGLELDHLCRNRRCVNPEHLRAVTRSVNTKAGWDARRAEALNVGLR